MSEVQTKTVETISVISLPFKGSYGQTGDRLDQLMSTAMRAGYPYSAPPMCIYYDDPAKVAEEELRAEVCLPMEEAYEGEGDIVRKTLRGTEVAYTMYEGEREGVVAVYQELFEWLCENGYRYREEQGCREIFHRLYGQVESPQECLSEVQVPVEKAE